MSWFFPVFTVAIVRLLGISFYMFSVQDIGVLQYKDAMKKRGEKVN